MLRKDKPMSFDLRAWRIWCGWSQSELAELAGLTPISLSELESGRAAPRASTLQRLAQAFGVPRSVLLHSTPEGEWVHGWRPPEREQVTI
jgi:transcriptional regulator with XRE-family HTH domain